MAKAYRIATYRSIKNPEALAAYAKLAGPAIWSAGGRNLVRGTPAKTLEEGLDLRTVVIEFENVASALAAYESPAYQAARKVWRKGRMPISPAWSPTHLSGEAEGVGRRGRPRYSHR